MSIWPRHRVEQDLRRRLASGEFDHYQLLPTTRQLAAHYGVSHMCVYRAMINLVRDGLVYGLPGSLAGRQQYRREGESAECSAECRERWH
jgi:DNA-binding transcriptional regulator YhcF (GntR family)